MYILYLDASGNAELTDTGSNHYVLVGVCLHEGSWFGLNQRVDALKTQYCSPGETFELHVTEFAGSIHDQGIVPGFDLMSWTDRRAHVQQIRDARIAATADVGEKVRLRKKYKRTQPFIHLSRAERSQLLVDALDLVAGHERIRLFGEAISKDHPHIRSGGDPVEQAFTQVVSRFDSYLQQRHAWKQKASPRASVDNGLLILDQDYSKEPKIHRRFEAIRRAGHLRGKLRHVIEIPMFAGSDRFCGLQIADVCAYALRRYLDRGAVVGSHEERNFQRIFRRFDQDSMGRLHGLRHYTPAGSCGCLICQQRGHSPPPLSTS